LNTLSLLKPLSIAVLLIIALISKNHAATLYSTGVSDWKWTNTSSWTSNSNGTGTCGCIPASGDIIHIRASDSISVPTNVNIAGNLTVHVYGELNITGFLDLNGTASVVNIYSGGLLSSNGSSSSKLRIGGTATAEYSGNDGNLNGPWTVSNGYSGSNTVLPVVLTSFSAVNSDGNIALTWSTSEEINNDHFKIQKSTDGETFVTIGQLNSNTTNSYSYTDNDASSSSPSYYRLLQVDIDGSATYSSIIKVSSTTSTKASVYPNPAIGNDFTIQFSNLTTGTLSIQTMNGNQLYAQAIEEKSFLSGQDIPALTPGIYFIIMNDGGNQTTQKIIIK
jgi:hypothetical protein